MKERPMHKINCTCAICLGPSAEPTRWQALSLLGLVLAGAALLWWA
jgi:hypothetical protein